MLQLYCINILFNTLMSSDLLSQLRQDYPNFVFKPGKKFAFHPPRTIYFTLDSPSFTISLLHELGHALLGHTTFSTDVERLKMERAAWDQATALAAKYDIFVDPNVIETALDTYRNWLHAKSKCQKCGLTRYQTRDGRYHCPYCQD